MSKSRVTSKYQVTIPKQVRERVAVRPGELVSVEAISENEIVLKVFPRVAHPLEILVGKSPARRRSVPIERVEEMAEER